MSEKYFCAIDGWIDAEHTKLIAGQIRTCKFCHQIVHSKEAVEFIKKRRIELQEVD